MKFTLTWFRYINSWHNVFPGLKNKNKNISVLEKNPHVNLITNLNFVKYSIILECSAFEHSTNRMLNALSGLKELWRGLGGQCLCEVARSSGNPLDIYLAMMTLSVFNELLKVWSMFASLIPVYDISISSQSSHSSAPPPPPPPPFKSIELPLADTLTRSSVVEKKTHLNSSNFTTLHLE